MGRFQRNRTLTRRWPGYLALFALVATAWLATAAPERAAGSSTAGYWLVGTDGGVFAFGRAGFHGSTGGVPLNQPIVSLAASPSGRGYWMVASDGGIFAFGDAPFLGSMGGQPLNRPVVAVTPTPTGRGYWLATSDGGIFAFGDAPFLGSVADQDLNKPVVDMAATPTGRGYWLVSSEGGVFAFGDAGFHGAVGDVDLAKRIHAMAATPTGRGYWLVAGDGGIFAFGDAGFHGGAGGVAEKRAIDIASSASGGGYYVTTSNGQVLAFGDATPYGGTDDSKLNSRIAAMAAMNGNEAPRAVDDEITVDEDGTVSVDVAGNDTDPEGGPLTIQSVGPPARGTAAVVGGTVTYRPAAEASGTDGFTYVVADDRGDVATGRVRVTVQPVDDRPAAVDDTVNVDEDASITVDVLANDNGLGDGVSDLRVLDQPRHGRVTVNPDRTLTYVPASDFQGEDHLRYRVVDADDDRAEAAVKVAVAAADDIPVAHDDGPFTVPAGRSFTMEVLENDQRGDGKAQIRLVDPNQGAPTDAGRLTTEAGEFRRSGEVIAYTPAAGFSGGGEIGYVIVDEDGQGDTSAPATVTFEVVNGAPKAEGQSLTIGQGDTARGRLRASDPDGDAVTYRVIDGSGPSPVRMVLDPGSGEFAFGPVNEPGRYSFQFVVSDGAHESEPARVTIEVRPAAQEPGAAEDSATTSTTAGDDRPASTTTTTREQPPTTTTTRPPEGDRADPERSTSTTSPPGRRGRSSR